LGYYILEGGGISTDVNVNSPGSGAYTFQFTYRAGSANQNSENFQVQVKGQTFDFPDSSLIQSGNWEKSPWIQVQLGVGRQLFKFIPSGTDSVHIETLRVRTAR